MGAGTILDEMFSDEATLAGKASRLEAYKAAMAATNAETDSGRVFWNGSAANPSDRVLVKGVNADPRGASRRIDEIRTELTKSLGADAFNASDMASTLAGLQAELRKDWTPSNPVGGTGLTPYDLEGPAKVLVPRDTPLRNSIPRKKGQGNARKFKRIDSWSNAGIPGGAPALAPFFNSLTQTAPFGGPGNLTLNRPQKISYTGSDFSVAYVELGFSDQVDWISQFEGLGFDDVRGLSHTAVLWAHLQGEERAALFARGASGNGYHGSVAAPGTIGGAVSTTGGTLPAQAGGYFLYVSASDGFGESLLSTVFNTAAVTGSTSSVTVSVGVEPTGSLGAYNLYAGTTTGPTNAHFQGTFTGNSFLWTAYNSTSAAPAGTDTSFQTNGYDGYLTVQSDPTLTGYFARQNAAFSTTSPGSEFDTALQQMYINNAADPDEFWMDGATRTKFGQLLRIGGTNGAASGYRTSVVTGDTSVTMGTAVTGYVNQNTGKVLDIRTHRFMPVGCTLIRSTSLPIVDANIPAPVAFVNVQDYMAVDWPVIQMSYDTSTYQIGTMVHYAPAWNGLIVGIK